MSAKRQVGIYLVDSFPLRNGTELIKRDVNYIFFMINTSWKLLVLFFVYICFVENYTTTYIFLDFDDLTLIKTCYSIFIDYGIIHKKDE